MLLATAGFLGDKDESVWRAAITPWSKTTLQFPWKDIVINLRDGVLTLTGEKKAEGNGSVYSERLHGKFERSIQLGSEIDSDKVTASFKHGVLTIAFAKRPDAQKQVKRISLGR